MKIPATHLLNFIYSFLGCLGCRQVLSRSCCDRGAEMICTMGPARFSRLRQL